MNDTPYCIAGQGPDAGPCEGPADAVLVRGPFMSRTRDAMTEPVPACVPHGARLFAILHGDRARLAVHENRLTAGPGGDEAAVADALARVEAAAEPIRCAAAAVPGPVGDPCDGRHDQVLVRPRFTARLRYGLDAAVPGCVHHGARLLVVSNGGSVTPGPSGTEYDANDVRARAERAWSALAGQTGHSPDEP